MNAKAQWQNIVWEFLFTLLTNLLSLHALESKTWLTAERKMFRKDLAHIAIEGTQEI
ncbi:MAG: hypothetical protein GX892_06090 [Thermoanaerobacteraceae bacterium]|nr:hypothetical protein [Thermoanaerobacteraceae bacterium]